MRGLKPLITDSHISCERYFHSSSPQVFHEMMKTGTATISFELTKEVISQRPIILKSNFSKDCCEIFKPGDLCVQDNLSDNLPQEHLTRITCAPIYAQETGNKSRTFNFATYAVESQDRIDKQSYICYITTFCSGKLQQYAELFSACIFAASTIPFDFTSKSRFPSSFASSS